jgi:hypothetical protein
MPVKAQLGVAKFQSSRMSELGHSRRFSQHPAISVSPRPRTWPDRWQISFVPKPEAFSVRTQRELLLTCRRFVDCRQNGVKSRLKLISPSSVMIREYIELILSDRREDLPRSFGWIQPGPN